MRVDIYWNLNRGGYSIRAVEGPMKNRVVGYAAGADLVNATFKVQAGARERVRRERVKSVHAWVRGELIATHELITAHPEAAEAWARVTYNPYKFDSFVELDGNGNATPIEHAERVSLRTNADTKRADVRASKEK